MNEYPLISAIMLAGKVKYTDINACIDCFNKQTYPNKELIIVNNAKSQFSAADLNVNGGSKDIHIFDTPRELSAGMARNYGISVSNGQILAQFDANYWYAPERLEYQISAIAKDGAHICMISKTLSYSYVSGQAKLYNNNFGAIPNTMVFVRPQQIDYPDYMHGEECEILRKMSAANMRSVAINKPELCCRLYFCDSRVTKPANIDLSKEQLDLIMSFI